MTMQSSKQEVALKKMEQQLSEASISQLNVLQQSQSKDSSVQASIIRWNSIPKAHCCPKTITSPSLAPVPMAANGDLPSLTDGSTLPTHDFEIDSNEAAYDSNSLHSAESSSSSSVEALRRTESNEALFAGIAQHFSESALDSGEGGERSPTEDIILMTSQEAETFGLNEEITEVLGTNLPSDVGSANEHIDLAIPGKDDHITSTAQPESSLLHQTSGIKPKLSIESYKGYKGTDPGSVLVGQEETLASVTEAMEGPYDYGHESNPSNMEPELAGWNDNQARVILVEAFVMLLLCGILFTLLALQIMHPSLLLLIYRSLKFGQP